MVRLGKIETICETSRVNNQGTPSLTTVVGLKPLGFFYFFSSKHRETNVTGMLSRFIIKKQMMMALTETLDKVTA